MMERDGSPRQVRRQCSQQSSCSIVEEGDAIEMQWRPGQGAPVAYLATRQNWRHQLKIAHGRGRRGEPKRLAGVELLEEWG
jgi:hypothetical protein